MIAKPNFRVCALALALLLGCGSAALAPEDVVGARELVEIAGTQISTYSVEVDGCTWGASGGRMVLQADGLWQMTIDQVAACEGSAEPREVTSGLEGRYELDGSTIRFVAVGVEADFSFTGRLVDQMPDSGSELLVTFEGHLAGSSVPANATFLFR